ncbi:MAG TPA: radical SAM protein [Acidisarcina sp.]|nr:radical SAM protein [Acidisarcina sp.]
MAEEKFAAVYRRAGSPQEYPLAHREAMFPILYPDHTQQPISGKPHLGRLTLNISNMCNLACSYCYADQGRYNAEENLMSPQQVEDVLQRVLDLYGEITVIHFFGGEPLMNLDAIETACSFLLAAVAEGRLPHMPRLALTTNGTWSSPEVLDVLHRWKISLTVSWDGSREIHDHCRPMLSGASSYELLADSLQRFRDHAIPFEIECTYNAYHQRNGISIVDLMDFFYKHTDRKILHISPAFLPRPAKLRMFGSEYVELASLAEDYRAAARVSIQNMTRGEGPILQFAYQVAEHLATRTPAQTYCPAFFTQITVATDGSVYPCFMLAGDPGYCMGNLLDGSFPGPDSARVLRQYFDEFQARPQAWYTCLCEGCIAGEAIVAGNMSEPVFAPIQRAIAEECVLQLAAHLKP